MSVCWCVHATTCTCVNVWVHEHITTRAEISPSGHLSSSPVELVWSSSPHASKYVCVCVRACALVRVCVITQPSHLTASVAVVTCLHVRACIDVHVRELADGSSSLSRQYGASIGPMICYYLISTHAASTGPICMQPALDQYACSQYWRNMHAASTGPICILF